MLLFKLTAVLILVFGISDGNLLNKYLEEISSPTNFENKVQEFLSTERSKGISSLCKSHLIGLAEGLESRRWWATIMLDAWSKIPSGILEGNVVDLGSFDECLKVKGRTNKSEEIFGKYCIGTIPFSNIAKYVPKPQMNSNILQLVNPEPRLTDGKNPEVGIRLATCFPEACSATDLEKLFKAIFKYGTMTFEEEMCQSKATAPDLSGGSIATLSFLGIILAIMLLSTAYDTAMYYLESKPAHSLLIAFSLFTNCKKLMATSNSPNQISCLHGIRVISTMWIILGHRYLLQASFPMRNPFALLDFVQDEASMFILGATVSVDTFFLISGLVVVYVYMSAQQKGMKFNIILYYFHRYLRLTPVLAVLIVIHVTLLRHLGSGPLWPTTVQNTFITVCENNWWKALLYIQNYGGLIDVCIPQTWYLSVDTQLFLLSPILLIPLKYWPKFTLAAAGFLTFCSTLSGFLISWFLELSPNLKATVLDPEINADYMRHYYLATWTRAAPWLIGFILGYFIFQAKQGKTRLVINKVVLIVSWAVALGILCTCVFAGHDVFVGDYNKLETSFYLSLVRPSWALALGWIIFACVTGNGGPVNWFLSLPLFQIVSKLTFTLYLVHVTIIIMVTAQMRSTSVFSTSNAMYVFWGDFAYTLAVALVLTLAFESPIIAIEKVLLGEGNKKRVEPAQTVETGVKSIDAA